MEAGEDILLHYGAFYEMFLMVEQIFFFFFFFRVVLVVFFAPNRA